MGKPLKEFRVDKLTGTYIKMAKEVPVYWSIADGERRKNVAFRKQRGESAGLLFAWVDAKNPNFGSPFGKGLWLVFKVNDDFNNGKSYYMRAEKGTINWAFTEQQLNQRKRNEMAWYDKYFDDLDTAFDDYIDDIKANVKSGLKTGLLIAGGVLVTYLGIIPYIKYKFLEGAAKKLIKEAKNG